jgi:hypothetical protein
MTEGHGIPFLIMVLPLPFPLLSFPFLPFSCHGCIPIPSEGHYVLRNSREQISILKIIVEKIVILFSVIVYTGFSELNLYDSVKLRSS